MHDWNNRLPGGGLTTVRRYWKGATVLAATFTDPHDTVAIMESQSARLAGTRGVREATRALGLTPGRVAVIAGLVIALAFVVQSIGLHFWFIGVDTYAYLAAAERLNAGHQLYALSAGDRPVVLMPPYWTVPLLSPPLVAVLWRPIVLLGGASLIVWWGAMLALLGWAIGMLVGGSHKVIVAAVVALLAPAIGAQALAGNLDPVLLVASLLAWRLSDGRHERLVGGLVAVAVAIKLTPFLLAWWLLVQRRWQAVRWMVAVGAAAAAVSVLGAGISAHLQYLDIARQTASQGASQLSLTGMAQALGLPGWIAGPLPYAALLAGALSMLVLRDRPGLCFAIAIAGGIFGSPVVSNTNLTRLLAAAAPLAYPQSAGRADPRPGTSVALTPPSRAVATAGAPEGRSVGG